MLEWPTVEITAELIKEVELVVAEKHAEGMPAPCIGNGDFTGYVAELVVYDWLRMLGIPASYEDASAYDFWVAFKYSVDVKALRCRSTPKPSYTAEIFEASLKYQQPNYFLFVAVIDDGPNTLPRRAHIVGGLSHADFMSLAHYQKAGDVSPIGYTYKTNRRAVYMNDLIPAEALAAEWRKELRP